MVEPIQKKCYVKTSSDCKWFLNFNSIAILFLTISICFNITPLGITHQQVIANAKQSKELKDKATPIQCKAQMESARFLLNKCSLHGDSLSENSLSEAFVEDAWDGKAVKVEVFNTVAQIGPTGWWHTTCGIGKHAQRRGATCSREHMQQTSCSMISWMLPGAKDIWSKKPFTFALHRTLSPTFAHDMKKPWVRGVSFATVSGVLCALLSNLSILFFF